MSRVKLILKSELTSYQRWIIFVLIHNCTWHGVCDCTVVLRREPVDYILEIRNESRNISYDKSNSCCENSFWSSLKWYYLWTKAVLPTVGWGVGHLIEKWMLGHCYHKRTEFCQSTNTKRLKVTFQPNKICSTDKNKWRCETSMEFENGIFTYLVGGAQLGNHFTKASVNVWIQ